MTSELLAPILQVATGIGFLLVLVIGLAARKAIGDVAGRLVAFSVLATTLGLFLLSRALGAATLNSASPLIFAAAVALLAGAALAAAGLVIRARQGA